MGYSLWDHKELDTTERLKHTHPPVVSTKPACLIFVVTVCIKNEKAEGHQT